jgi:hypothetical protein
MISLCAAHHLFGLHGGYLRVWGRAPDGLVFERVERPISTEARPPLSGEGPPCPRTRPAARGRGGRGAADSR